MNLLKQDLAASHYSWMEEGKNNIFVGQPSRRTFNRFNGDQVLFMINFYCSAHGRSSITEAKKIEMELMNHLPLEVQSEISVFHWLRFHTSTKD